MDVTYLSSMQCSTLTLEVHTVLQTANESISVGYQCLSLPVQDLKIRGWGNNGELLLNAST